MTSSFGEVDGVRSPRHFTAVPKVGSDPSEADMPRVSGACRSGETDLKRTWSQLAGVAEREIIEYPAAHAGVTPA